MAEKSSEYGILWVERVYIEVYNNLDYVFLLYIKLSYWKKI